MTAMIPTWIGGDLVAVEKLEVHRKGLRHKAVSVFLMNRGKVLLQQRALCKYHTPGLWANTCCTHPLWGEEPLDCAVRRLNEELGITASLDLRHMMQVEYRANVGNDLIEHEVVEMFVAEVEQDLPLALNPEEVIAVEWVDMAVLVQRVEAQPELYTPWLQIYLKEHGAEIFA